jgi:hypothetical protein
MFIQKSNFIIKCREEDENFIESINFGETYKKVNNFFNFNKVMTIRINFIYSIEDYIFFSGNNFENWNCGFVGYPNMIFVFSPSVIEKLTIHKKEEIPKIIIHELSHVFYGTLKFVKLGILDEGIATYLGFYEEHKKNIASQKQKNNPNKDIYHKGFLIIDEIIEKLGRNKLLEFLENTKNLKSEEIIQQLKKLNLGVKKYGQKR